MALAGSSSEAALVVLVRNAVPPVQPAAPFGW